MAQQLVEVQWLACGVVHQSATQSAIGAKHRGATLLPRITLDALLAKARSQGAQRVPEHAGAQHRPQAAAQVQCAEGSPIWITEHGQSAAMLVGKCSGLRWLGGAHKHDSAIAGGKLSLAAAQLRDPFSTEHSTKVPHEHRDQWSGVQMRAQ